MILDRISTLLTQNTKKYNGVEFEFAHQPSSDLFCCECHQLACEPHQSKCCYSLFCKKCIPAICPICQKRIESIPDGRTQNRIQTLELVCPNSFHGLGCDWKGKLGDVFVHRLFCPREEIVCPYNVLGCVEKMKRESLKEHEEKSRDEHLNLSMKTVVSMATTIEELQERVVQLEREIQMCMHDDEIYVNLPS